MNLEPVESDLKPQMCNDWQSIGFNSISETRLFTDLSSADSPLVSLTLCFHHETASLCQDGCVRLIYFVRCHSG